MGSIGRILRSGGNSPIEESRPQSSRAEGLIQEFESSEKGWFWETTKDGTLSYISESVARALGREPEDVVGRPFTDLISTDTADGSATSERTLGFYLSSHVAFQDLVVRAKTKTEIWWSITGRPVHDDIGRFFGFRGFASDLTKIRQSEVELDKLARQDALTGLANRRHLMAAIDTEVRRARRTGRALSLAILDIDHFKRINDTHGHPGGDGVLREIAALLRETTRETDLLGRIGGEEFAVLMPETDPAQAERACERLRAAVAGRTIDLASGVVTRVTISTGVALLSAEEAGEQLLARADGALYEAKAGGRNQVRMAA